MRWISPTARLVAEHFGAWVAAHDGCTPSLSQLAMTTGLSTYRVASAFLELDNAGWLRRIPDIEEPAEIIDLAARLEGHLPRGAS